MEASNLLELPKEIRFLVMQIVPFSPYDITSLLITSKQLRQELAECLTKLSFSQRTMFWRPLLSSLPNLDSCEYPIIIRSEQDLLRVARHPKIKEITLDLTALIDRMMQKPVRKSLEKAVLLFIREYIHCHSSLIGTSFTIIFPDRRIDIRNNRLYNYLLEDCNRPSKNRLSEYLWSDPDFIDSFNEIVPIFRYCGFYFVKNIEEIGICYTSYFAIFHHLGSFLNSSPKLKRFGIYPGNPYIKEELLKYGLFRTLNQGMTFPNLITLDFPIDPLDLHELHRVFPNLREPLLISLDQHSDRFASQARAIRDNSKSFAGSRVLDDVTLNLVSNLGVSVRFDSDNIFLNYLC